MKEPKALRRVEVKTESKIFRGILLERPELADKEHLVLKLDSGYNIGIRKDTVKGIKDLGAVKKEKHTLKGRHKTSGKKPKVSVVATGGTIASRVDYLTGGVHSAFSAEELITAVPELKDIADIHGKQVFNKFSENMQPNDWVKIAGSVAKEIKDRNSGVVVTHGTDTMGYSSAALAFMLKTPVPVVVTGAQRSSDRGSSDASLNLLHATKMAAEADYGGVCVVMHEGMSDNTSLIHSPVRVRKLHSSRRDAFHSINSRPLGRVSDDKIEFFSEVNPRGGRLSLDAKLEKRVTLLKYSPGMNSEVLDFFVDRNYKGVVLEGTGLGHVSEGFFDSVKNAVGSGLTVCMTTQTLFGRVNMNVYSTGRMLLDYGVIPCADMLPETAYVKLMWVLGHTKKPGKVREMLLTDVAGELSEKTEIDEFEGFD